MNTEENASELAYPKPGNEAPGYVLVTAGKITAEAYERILKRQKETGESFGEAGKELKLITNADISFALSKQFEFPYPVPVNSKVSKAVTTAHSPFSAQAEVLRTIRSKLALSWASADHMGGRTLAIVSAQTGDGRSWLTANLAVLFSQLGQRTLLIDADLRNPSQHKYFALPNETGLSTILSGLASTDAIRRLPEFIDLSIIPSGVLPPNPQEVISRPEFAFLLNRVRGLFDVILIDTPPLSKVADAQIISSYCGNALFVAKKNKSKITLIDKHLTELQRSSVTICGSVLLD